MSFVNVIEKMASIPNFFLSSRTANFKNFGISSITSKRKMKWVIKVKLEAKKVLQSVQNFFSFSVPSRWKSDDNMLNTQNEAYDINGHKVSRSGSARSFIRGGRKNSWVKNVFNFSTFFSFIDFCFFFQK